jgi:hypothetical protein
VQAAVIKVAAAQAEAITEASIANSPFKPTAVRMSNARAPMNVNNIRTNGLKFERKGSKYDHS